MKAHFVKIIRQNGELAFSLMKMFSKELDLANCRMISLTQKHVRGRIAESILLLRDIYGTDADGITIRLFCRGRILPISQT
ncbi:MAG: hypothetical protein IPI69_04230 [Bacteroidales bacterium]|nr:hypothetical protein [Bacteroidales bacterium]